MCTSNFGILRRMPWMRYSFDFKSKITNKRTSKFGISADDIGHKSLDTLDTSKLLTILGKLTEDDSSMESADWNLLYGTFYNKLKKDTKERDLRWSIVHTVKFLQNAAYVTNYFSRKSLPLDDLTEPIAFARTFIAKNINEVNDNELIRVIFSCSKGRFMSHGLVTKAFLTLLDNEVIQRLDTFQSLQILKILHSTITISNYFHDKEDNEYSKHPFGIEFTRCLSTRLLRMISHIGSIDMANFVTIMAHYGLFNKTLSEKLNKSFLKRLWGIKTMDPVLISALSLSMYGILGRKTAIFMLNSLESFGIPSYTSGHDPRFVNSLLFSLKLLEMCIRHNNVEVHKSLPSSNRLYLKKIRDRIAKCVDHRDLLYGITFNSRSLVSSLNDLLEHERRFDVFSFAPYIHGPYLMEICDPINKITIEFDEPWRFGHNEWLSSHLSHFHKMRRVHLENEGFKFIRVPNGLDTPKEGHKS
ncbi:hypothetical protein BEWA_037910 [Theileria equi strain WA]|uniref:RAP domain-containing protein n=1 Tax=Theileria equi strain WA TaxID=1537102 RepID=L1LER8_THEEQ|nr:hypothetical protein BEWA_037910 [Theileria equi strain WA]EKX73754.1 hypothetical protein BEWA_037910 [Theileria equi strain WA]|eukprot:XP_004833206.1 hypothetical protein BEWA_037910 [Theileria equi strain WA]